MITHFNIKTDLTESINVIYTTFCKINSGDSSEKLKNKMHSLFGPWCDIPYVTNIFESSSIVLVAKDKGKIIWIIRWKENRLANLFVDTQYHGQGIGKQLLDQFEIEAKKLWYQEVYLKSSQYALKFYLKNGYIPKWDTYLYKSI